MLKVLNVKCHVGAYIRGQVFTTLDSEKNKLEMFMNNVGVFVKKDKANPVFIPHSTICSIEIDHDSFQEFVGEQEKKSKAKSKVD